MSFCWQFLVANEIVLVISVANEFLLAIFSVNEIVLVITVANEFFFGNL